MKLGLGLSITAWRPSAPSGPANIAAPVLTATQAFPGGGYRANFGMWSGSPTITRTWQTSADGVTWADSAVPFAASGAFSTSPSWGSLYARFKETPSAGSPAYSNAVQLGPYYQQSVGYFGSGLGNWLTTTVTTPFAGAAMQSATTGASAGGFWFHCMFYWEGGALGGALMSLGNLVTSLTNADITPQYAWARDGGGVTQADLSSAGRIAAAGHYIVTARFYTVASVLKIDFYLMELSTTATGGGLNLNNFNAFRIGDTANPSNIGGSRVLMQNWLVGRGDPAAMHAWAYNGGVLRNAIGYDFTGDTACELVDYKLMCRANPGNQTFTASDANGVNGVLTGWTVQNTIQWDGVNSWSGYLPGFVNAAGPAPASPQAFPYPGAVVMAGETITLGWNGAKIGSANPALFTWTSITHSVSGAITPSGGQFSAGAAGTITITGLKYNGGTAYNYTIDVMPVLATNFDPSFKTVYGGNARAAYIQPYTSPGAGTTYANTGALATALSSLASGATLISADLSAAGSTLTIPAKDYGGATLTCTNRHGVVVDFVVLDGVSNLTIRGVKAVKGCVNVAGTCSNITLDQCSGGWTLLEATTPASSVLSISNWIGLDDGTAEQMTATGFYRVNVTRTAHGNIANTLTTGGGDNLHLTGVAIRYIDRCWFGENHCRLTGAHLDNIQNVNNGSTGTMSGLIVNTVCTNSVVALDEKTQGVTVTQCNPFLYRVINCAVQATLTGSLGVQGVVCGVGIENCFGSGDVAFSTDTPANAGVARNNVIGRTGAIIPTVGQGLESGTVNTTSYTDKYPNWNSFAGWQRWTSPDASVAATGPYQVIADLVANLGTYG